MIELFVVSDIRLYREGLSRILSDNLDINVIGEAENATQALATICKIHPEIVLLDMKMPGMDGLEFIRTIRLNKAAALLANRKHTVIGLDPDAIKGAFGTVRRQ